MHEDSLESNPVLELLQTQNPLTHLDRAYHPVPVITESPITLQYRQASISALPVGDSEEEEPAAPLSPDARDSILIADPPSMLGRLAELALSPLVRAFLEDGDTAAVSPRGVARLRGGLRLALAECAERVWVEEAGFVNERLAWINATERSPRVLGFHREDRARAVGEVADEIVQREADMDAAILELRARLEQDFAAINDEYQQEAEALDWKYDQPETTLKFAKPSGKLLALRKVTQTLLKRNQPGQAAKYAGELARLEMEEVQRCSGIMRRRYETDDRDLKRKFDLRKEVRFRRFLLDVAEEEMSCARDVDRFEKRVVKLKAQIDLEKRSPRRIETRSTSPGSPPQIFRGEQTEFATTGRLRVTSPLSISRKGGFDEIERMAVQNLTHGSPRSPRANALLREVLPFDV
jgi:hypothetical protein